MASAIWILFCHYSPGALSESEVELDGEHNEVELPQNMPGKGNAAHEQSAIRLVITDQLVLTHETHHCHIIFNIESLVSLSDRLVDHAL